ncbi:MAG: hypothetical protein BACD_00128 [Bacteroides rodentium]
MNYPERLKDGHYYVKNGEKEIGKYKTLSGAKKACDANEGSAVFSEDGARIYPSETEDNATHSDTPAAEQIEGQIFAGQKEGHTAAEQMEISVPKTAVLKALMNVRKAPALNAEKIDTAKSGAEIAVISIEGDWLKVDWKGSPAYILYDGGKYADLK